MAGTTVHHSAGSRGESQGFRDTFERLTPKQHEVLQFVSENRTSKEIAWELGISESAVNQRIEGVRIRTGSPPRAELARAYRQYLQGQGLPDPDIEDAEACNPVPDKIPQVPENPLVATSVGQDERIEPFALSDAVTYNVTAPWQRAEYERIVPGVLDGANAGLSRTAAMIAIAGGILLVAMVGLGVVHALVGLA